jgi:hypothetical protein
MDHTAMWLAHEKTRELRHQAAEARRARAGRPGPARSLLRALRGER